jgi:predicted permease
MFFRPLAGVHEPQRLIAVNFGTPRGERGGYTVSRVSYAHLAHMATASPAVRAIAGWQPANVAVGRPGQAPRPLEGEYVSAAYFDVMGVRLAAGRPFAPEEDRYVTGPVVAVIGAGLAERLFDVESPLNKPINVNGSDATVVGVAPKEFAGIERSGRAEIWLPGILYRRIENFLPETWAYRPDDGPFYMHVARLAPDGTRERASVELTRAALALSTNDPTAREYESVRPLVQDDLPGPTRFKTIFGVLFGAAALVVLLGAANLANLFVFRAIRRSQEGAIRRALGASSARLARMHLAEACTIALAGALAGIGVALFLKSWIGTTLLGGQIEPPLILDHRLLSLTLAVAGVVALILGTLPARLATRVHAAGVLGRSPSTSTPRGAKVRTSLAVVQLALSLILLVGALLFTTTLRNLRAINPGIDPTGVLMVTHEFRMRGYQQERIAQYFLDAINRLRLVPAVASVAVASGVPVARGGMGGTVLAGAAGEQKISVNFAFATPEYFEALRIPMLAGRTFENSEVLSSAAERSIVISQSLARHLFGERDVIGRTMLMPEYQQVPHEVRIVGVVADVRFNNLTDEPGHVVYRPLPVRGAPFPGLLVRLREGASRGPEEVKQAIASVDPDLPIMVLSLQSLIDRRIGPQRLFAWMSGALSVLGFLLAAIGMYGLASQAALERTREFGIRLALGAAQWQIVRLPVRSALVVSAIGASIGVLLAVLASRVIASQLVGVTATDPALYGLAVVTLLSVVIIASAIPAWLGSRVNPVDVMRAE